MKFQGSGSKKIGDLDKSLVSYRGTTTADGGALGINLICSALIALSDYDGNQVVITSGACAGQARDINGTTLAGTVTPASAFDAQITIGTKFVITAIRTTPAEVAAIDAKIGTATDNADQSTLFAKHKRTILATHAHVLLIVTNTAALDADLDIALRDFLLDLGYDVTVADPADVVANLDYNAFDFLIVSGSCDAGDVANLANLRTANLPVLCHSAAIAVSTVFNLGTTAGSEATQTQIEIVDNTPGWLIEQALGDLTVTASATIYKMSTKTTDAISIAETATGTGNDHFTIVKLPQGEEDGGTPAYAPFYDRYFNGVADYTNANAVWKALMAGFFHHMLHEKRFGEDVLAAKRVYQEQIPDDDVSDTATTTEADCVLLEIGPLHNRRYCLRNFRLKAQADPNPDTITVRLYEYFAGALVEVDSFNIDTANWGTYHSLMDMFAVPEVHSDAIKITCKMDANSYAVKATYGYAEAKK